MEVDGDKSSHGIVQKIDIKSIGLEFVKTFYHLWKTDIDKLKELNLISQEYVRGKIRGTKLVMNGKVYTGEEVLVFMKSCGEVNFQLKKIDFLDNGTRCIDILVIGTINKTIFSQSFVLCNLKNKWFIKNSILVS